MPFRDRLCFKGMIKKTDPLTQFYNTVCLYMYVKKVTVNKISVKHFYYLYNSSYARVFAVAVIKESKLTILHPITHEVSSLKI